MLPTVGLPTQAVGEAAQSKSALTRHTCNVSEDLLFYVLFTRYYHKFGLENILFQFMLWCLVPSGAPGALLLYTVRQSSSDTKGRFFLFTGTKNGFF